MFIYRRKYPFFEEDNSWTGIQGTSGISALKNKAKSVTRAIFSPEEKKKRDLAKQTALLEEMSLVFSSKKDKSSITAFINANSARLKKAFKVFPYVTPKMEIKEESVFLYELKNGAEVYYDFDNKIGYYLNGYFDTERDFVGYINKNNKIDKNLLTFLYETFKGDGGAEPEETEGNQEEQNTEDTENLQESYYRFYEETLSNEEFVESVRDSLIETMQTYAGITPKVEMNKDGKGVVLFVIDANGAEVSYDFENKSFVYYLNAYFDKPGEFSRYVKKLKQKISDNLLEFTDSLIRKMKKPQAQKKADTNKTKGEVKK